MSVGALITWPYKAGGHSRWGSPKAGTTVEAGLGAITQYGLVPFRVLKLKIEDYHYLIEMVDAQ